MNAIVIATTKGRHHWASECLESLESYDKCPIILLDRYAYELGKIRWVYEHTDIDQFLFLQDSVVVKQYDWIDRAFAHDGSVSICHSPFFMYLGKYTRETLDKVGMPEVTSKREAVINEGAWTQRYADADKNLLSLFRLTDTNQFEERHGRLNMIIENEHLRKYKGTWSPAMIRDDD